MRRYRDKYPILPCLPVFGSIASIMAESPKSLTRRTFEENIRKQKTMDSYPPALKLEDYYDKTHVANTCKTADATYQKKER